MLCHQLYSMVARLAFMKIVFNNVMSVFVRREFYNYLLTFIRDITSCSVCDIDRDILIENAIQDSFRYFKSSSLVYGTPIIPRLFFSRVTLKIERDLFANHFSKGFYVFFQYNVSQFYYVNFLLSCMTSFLRSRMASLNCISIFDRCMFILSFCRKLFYYYLTLFAYFTFYVIHFSVLNSPRWCIG